MQESPQYYRGTTLLTGALVSEPSVTLIENGPAFFGALISDSCHQNSWQATLFLENTTWFHVSNHSFRFMKLGSVALEEADGLYLARHLASGAIIPNMSKVPLRTIFIDNHNFEALLHLLELQLGSLCFTSIQQRFGILPGFKAFENALTTPAGYAEIPPSPPFLSSAS